MRLVASTIAAIFWFISGVLRNARTFHPDGRTFLGTVTAEASNEKLLEGRVQEYVASFARPGSTVTGFASSELTLVGKRLALLRELSPRTLRVLYVTSRLVGAGTRDLLARISNDAAAAGISTDKRHPMRTAS